MRKTLFVILAVLLAALLCACGNKTVENTSSPEPTATAEATATPSPTATPTAEPTPEATPSAPQLQLGDTIENDNFKMTLNSVEVVDRHEFSTSENSTIYSVPENGYRFLLLRGHFENKSTNVIPSSSIACTVLVNDVFTVNCSRAEFVFERERAWEIDPFTDFNYSIRVSIPQKLADDLKSAVYTIQFNDDMSAIDSEWQDDGSLSVTADETYNVIYGTPSTTSTSSESSKTSNNASIVGNNQIECDAFNMTFDSAEIVKKYEYPLSEYSTTSQEAENGYKLLVLRGHIENKSTEKIKSSSFSCSVDVNGVFAADTSRTTLNFERVYHYEMDPFTDVDYFIFASIPEKIADNFEHAVFDFCFNNNLTSNVSAEAADNRYCITYNGSDSTLTLENKQ